MEHSLESWGMQLYQSDGRESYRMKVEINFTYFCIWLKPRA